MTYTINHTMMRIDLASPMKPGTSLSFSVKWSYNINDYQKEGGRSGYESFKEGNRIYVMHNSILEWQFIMMSKVGKICSFGKRVRFAIWRF
jgi:hypothetical protein